MASNTRIEWCTSTWNPVTGCLHGCEYCYARTMTRRFCGNVKDNLNTVQIDGTGIYTLSHPFWKNDQHEVNPYPAGFAPTFHEYRLEELQHWKKPRVIFVCSMADLFGNWVPDEWIEKVFEACEKAPQHQYLFLTKNPLRYASLNNSGRLPLNANMWYGTTLTDLNKPWWSSPLNQMFINTFLSIEPISSDFSPNADFGTNWVIIGAETGRRKDKVIPERAWVEHVCEAADRRGTPVFMKESLLPIMGEDGMRREMPRFIKTPKEYAVLIKEKTG